MDLNLFHVTCVRYYDTVALQAHLSHNLTIMVLSYYDIYTATMSLPLLAAAAAAAAAAATQTYIPFTEAALAAVATAAAPALTKGR